MMKSNVQDILELKDSVKWDSVQRAGLSGDNYCGVASGGLADTKSERIEESLELEYKRKNTTNNILKNSLLTQAEKTWLSKSTHEDRLPEDQ